MEKMNSSDWDLQEEGTLDWMKGDLLKRLREHQKLAIKGDGDESHAKALKMEVLDELEERDILDSLRSLRIYRQYQLYFLILPAHLRHREWAQRL